MKKIIDIPDEIVKELKIVAVKNDTDLKNYIQDLILNQYQITKVTEMAQNAMLDGQSTRFIWNYLSETFESLKVAQMYVDKVKFETIESFVEHVKYVCEIMLESLKTENNG